MAQVKKLLEGGKTPSNPEVMKVYGVDYEKNKFFNTLNNNSNIDSYIYNTSMNGEEASLFRDALSQYNLGILKNDHPGVKYIDGYIKELMLSPALSVYLKKPKLTRTEGEMFIKGFINKYYGGNKELFVNDWFDNINLDETTRANKFADYLSNIDAEELYDTFDFSNSAFSSAQEVKNALDEISKELKENGSFAISDSAKDKALMLGLNLKSWIKKPEYLNSENEGSKKEEKTETKTEKEELEELRKLAREIAIKSGLKGSLIDDFVEAAVNKYLRGKNIAVQKTLDEVDQEKAYSYLLDVYDKSSVFGENGRLRYAGWGGGFSSNPYKDLWVSNKFTLSNEDTGIGGISFLQLRNNYLKYKSGDIQFRKTLIELLLKEYKDGGIDIDVDNIDTANPNFYTQLRNLFYHRIKNKLLLNFNSDGKQGKLTVGEQNLLYCFTNNLMYIPISGIKGDPYNVLCYRKDRGIYVKVPLFSKYMLAILKSEGWKEEKNILNRIMNFFENTVKKTHPNINLKILKLTLIDYENDRSAFAREHPDNPYDTSAEEYMSRIEGSITNGNENGEEIISNKLGGVLKYQAGGDITLGDLVYLKLTSKGAEEKGISEEAYRENYGKDIDFGSDFNTRDWLRFGALGADVIGLAASFVPGLGTGVAAVSGLGSFAADTAADWTDDSMTIGDKTWSTVKNFGLGLLGLFPGGKTGSVTAKVVRWLPRIVGFLGAAHAAPEIISSFKKLASGEAMTRQDWNNIWDGGRIMIAGARETSSFRKGKRYTVENTEGSIVRIKTTEGRIISLTGKNATEYRKLKTVEEKNTFLKNLDGENKLKADESINMSHWNSMANVRNIKHKLTTSALPEEFIVLRGKYRFMTPEEVLAKYGMIPRSYARLYKTLQWYENIGNPDSGMSMPFGYNKSALDLFGLKGLISKRSFTLEELNAGFSKAENTAGKNAAKRAASQINAERAKTEVATDGAQSSPQINKANLAAGNGVLPEKNDSWLYVKRNGSIYRKKKENGKRWFKLNEHGMWDFAKSNEIPRTGTLLSFDFKHGGKLYKYILKAQTGLNTSQIKTNLEYPLNLTDLNYYFKTNDNVHKGNDLNKTHNIYKEYFYSPKYIQDINALLQDFLTLHNDNGAIEEFKSKYNSDINNLNAFWNITRPSIKYGESSNQIGDYNEIFSNRFKLYSEYKPELKNTAAILTLSRIIPKFSSITDNWDNRHGEIEHNGITYKYYIDNNGNFQYLKEGQNYPTTDEEMNSQIGITNGGNTNLPTALGENTSTSATKRSTGLPWSSGNVYDILSYIFTGEDAPKLESKKEYDLSVPMELAKFLNTAYTNNRVFKEAMKIPYPLKSSFHKSSIQADLAGNRYNTQNLIASLMLNANKLASLVSSPDKALAIMLSAMEQAGEYNQRGALLENLLKYKNQENAVTAANENLEKDIATSNENAAKIAQINTAKLTLKTEKIKSDSANILSILNFAIERYNKANALKNTATAHKLASDLSLYYDDLKARYAYGYNMHVQQAYNDWKARPENNNKKYDDFIKEWNTTHKRVWDEVARNLLSYIDRKYVDSLYLSSRNSAENAAGITTTVATPPYVPKRTFFGVYKKGGSLTGEERMALLDALNRHELNMLYLKENSKKNLLKERALNRQSSLAFKNIALLINKALGV